ncbi:hypothetical protein ABPG72_022243 [Tetrahymena utriculariae]
MRNHTSSVSSSRAFKDCQKQENEENYESRWDINENTDNITTECLKQISRSQFEILQQQTQRQQSNCIQSPNSTNYPKINLQERQSENIIMEENYVSRWDINENTDNITTECRKQISRSQFEILLQQKQRQQSNCIQSPNSTIYPKINLQERQQENIIMEHNYDQQESNLLTKPSFKQRKSLKTSQDTDSDIRSQDLEQNTLKNKQQKFNNDIPLRRCSRDSKSENFQNECEKIIENKSIKCTQGKLTIKQEQSEFLNCEKAQNSEEINQSELQSQQKRNQLSKVDKKQIFKKREEQLWNVFVVRLGIFQRFLRNIKNLSESYKFRMMNLDQKQKFNDLSFFQSKQKKINNSISVQKILFKILSKLLSKFSSTIKVFNPLNSAVICLELVMLATLIIQIFILPLIDSFDISVLQEGIFYLLIYSFPVIMFSISILVKLNTGFFKENIVVSDRKQIFLNYYQREGLILDLTIILSFLWTKGFYNYLFLLLKLYQIQNSIIKIDIKFSLSYQFALSFQISKLILLVLMLAHINGCVFNQVAKNLQESWLIKNNLQDTGWYERYINSLYFSFITMATVGYGDITPVSLQEKVFVIFMVVYSCGIFGYILSSIGNIFTERAQVKANYKRQLIDIIDYMRIRSIDQMLQQKAFQYLHYLEKMENYNHLKGQQIVQKLSPDLQQQININSYYPFLKNSNYFKLNFKDSILIHASLKMKELTFGPGQIIFNQNDLDNRIYFILKGKVQLSINDHIICIKEENDNCFGVNEFFTGEARSLQAKSISVSQILFLELSNFKEVLKEDQLEYEKFCSLRDQIIFSKISVDQSCYFCNKYSHVYDQCPFYTLKNQRILMIEKSKRNTNQVRQQFKRRFPLKFNCMQDNEKVKLNLKAVRLNYINKLAYDKNEMIQLIKQNVQNQNDVDFYRTNNSFQLKFNEKEEEEEFSIILLNSNEVGTDFISEEDEQMEQSGSVETFTHVQNPNNKKIGRCSIVGGDNFIEEQKIPSSTNFMNSYNQIKRKNSIMQNPIQIQNNSNSNSRSSYSGDRLHQFIEQSQQTNSKMQNFYQQTSSNPQRRQSNSSQKQSQASNGSSKKIQDQFLFNQIIEFITQAQAKQECEKSEMQTIFQKDQFFTIINFDQMKNYTRYFPKSNFTNILTKYNNISQMKQKSLIKKYGKIIKIRNAIFCSSAFKKSNKPFIQQQIKNPIKLDIITQKKNKFDFLIHKPQDLQDADVNFKIQQNQKITNSFR